MGRLVDQRAAPRWLLIVVGVAVAFVVFAWLLTADDLNGLLGSGS